MAKVTGLNVYLNVSDVARSRAFYEGLGLRKVLDFPEWDVVGYRLGEGSMLMIGPAESDDPETNAWLKQRPWGVGSILMPTVSDVDAIYRVAQAMGADIDQAPADQPWGSRTLVINDPDGYVITFDQPTVQASPLGARTARRSKTGKRSAKKARSKARKTAKRSKKAKAKRAKPSRKRRR